MSIVEHEGVPGILNELESGRGYVLEVELEKLSGRELVQLRRQAQPAAVVDVIDGELIKRSGAGVRNRDRARAYFLAEFYAWSARKPTVPAGGHPLTGQRWRSFDRVGMAIARAENMAAARVAYRVARESFPNPLPA